MDRHQAKILVVEDEPAMLGLLLSHLGNAGYLAEGAADGQIAWDRLNRSPHYSAIIVDRNMPHLDGLQLNQLIKNDPRLKHTPVIMQTGVASPKDVATGIKAGVYYYLIKPYEEESLISVVASALREQRHNHLLSEQKNINDNALRHLVGSTFRLRTLSEAESIAALLGNLFPKPDYAAAGIYELLANAIEHGNLGIGFETKAQLLSLSKFDSEIKSRMMRSENLRKTVQIDFVRMPDRIDVTITDQGMGFDWQPFLEMDPARAIRGNGRGIAKSNEIYFNVLQYQGRGNRVTATSFLDSAVQAKSDLKWASGTHG
jgi:CheY-like chemotaxis protein/anti-sigma regulatory factor (Ser/Thr protein kinase)